MARIYVDFDGLQDLKVKVNNVLNQLAVIESDITRAVHCLDWEVSPKRSIEEQLYQARRKASRLTQRTEHMQLFVQMASSEFMRSDVRCANEHKRMTGFLEKVWKGMLGYSSRTFNQLGQVGMDMLASIRQIGQFFGNQVTEVKRVELDHIRPTLLVSSVIIAKLGSVNLGDIFGGRIKELHYEKRSALNTGAPCTEQEAKKLGWIKLPDEKSMYHQQGLGNESNAKYVSPDGKMEGVYSKYGTLVTDPVNMPTYNFASPNDDSMGHFVLDVLPYYAWGNSPDDPTTTLGRVTSPANVYWNRMTVWLEYQGAQRSD